jgi:hydrogenase large subunit
VQKIELIEKIEGEAQVLYRYEGDRVADARIRFLTGRHVERILEGRDPGDALAINPRICGICGHAHLIATVRALEGCYPDLRLPRKAEIVRELTLTFELLQNHFKWFYLTIFPLLFPGEERVGEAVEPARKVGEMIALIAGKYPHNSYALPGGITAEVSPLDLVGVSERLREVERHFSRNLIDVDPGEFSRCDRIETMLEREGDLPRAMEAILDREWQRLGRSFDRFIVFGGGGLFESGKSLATRVTQHLDLRYLSEEPIEESEALLVRYRGKVYETGPLARAMLLKTPLIREAHRRYGDSIFSRILARVCEIPRLLLYCRRLLEEIDLFGSSWEDPGSVPKHAEGVGIVEAARGSLIHRVRIGEGLISEYQIVTPTQWNLGSGPADDPGIAQRALIGLHREEPAELVFKSFDVCSVCTTH